MNEDCLKLTTYFGERHRVGGRLVADELLDLYGRRGLEVSVLLRGAEGFGLKHHLRTDRLLTLSEDLPLVSVAVDRRARIEQVRDEVVEAQPEGVVTLERARMLTEDLSPVTLSDGPGEATKLTVYLGRKERVGGLPAFRAVCELLHRRGLAGASVLLGVDGTLRGARERASFVGRNVDVPLMIIAIGEGERIGRVLPELSGLLRRPLVTLEQVTICKRDGRLLAPPPTLPGRDERGLALWQKVMVYSAEGTQHEGMALHVALVRRLREARGRGATALRGVWGFHGDHPPHGDRLLGLRRRVPVVTVIVDTPEGIARTFPLVDEVTRAAGLVTSETVPALTAVHEERRRGGLRLSAPGR